ncbi:MAG: UDP-N-acetylglucosamine 2-epimerase, partial [Deltaproteobacteria bacterium]|nr:UDP-N-acetylglucosamine 2-epimerase [Deltaproteobacteria bacterium]
PENRDDPENLSNILSGLRKIASNGMRLLLPVHPGTMKCIQEAGLAARFDLIPSEDKRDGLSFIEPVGYLDMIQLERCAYAIFTDSGGIQKEAFLLKVPCITLRNETEWVETISAGWNILSGADTDRITDAFSIVSGWNRTGPPFPNPNNSSNPTNPFGDGRAAEKIVEYLKEAIT